MGVSGCGKSAVGVALAKALGARFIEGDSLHPADNVARMARGEPLTDALREGWLDAIGLAVQGVVAGGQPVVASCSALKRIYRDRLRHAEPSIVFIHLVINRAEAFRRVSRRRGHYMPSSLVDSQFEALEPPGADEAAMSISAMKPIADIVARVRDFVAMERTMPSTTAAQSSE